MTQTPKTLAQLRMEKISPERRKEIARNAVAARWKKTTKKQRKEYSKMMLQKKYEANPPKSKRDN